MSDAGDTAETSGATSGAASEGSESSDESFDEASDEVGGGGVGEESEAASGEDKLAAAVAQRDAYLEDLQRVTAEFANFRRQTTRRNAELVAQAASRLAKELLPVLDACEAAVTQGVEGIEAVQTQLLAVLGAEGLAVLGGIDEPFDPGFHEAVMRDEPADGDPAEPVVSEVVRTGYAWHGRVLRPAMVKVRG